jgi:CRP-like cAMP-binding protein
MSELHAPELETVEIGRIERLHTLRLLFGHEGPSTLALAALAQLTTPVRIPKGTVLSREGEPTAAAYFIIEGAIEAWRGDKRLGVFVERGSVGALGVFARDPRGVYSVATEDTIALRLRAEDVMEVMEDHFELMLSAMRGLASDAIEKRRGLLPHAGFNNEIAEPVECSCSSDRPLDLVERIFCLRRTFGLRNSHIDELAEIAKTADEKRYFPGTRLWSAGDPADHVVLIVRGMVEGKTPEGAHFRVGPGDILGQLDTVARVPRWFDAVVTEPLVALELSGELIVDVLEDQPELGFDFLRMLARTLLSLREAMADSPARSLPAASAAAPPP